MPDYLGLGARFVAQAASENCTVENVEIMTGPAVAFTSVLAMCIVSIIVGCVGSVDFMNDHRKRSLAWSQVAEGVTFLLLLCAIVTYAPCRLLRKYWSPVEFVPVTYIVYARISGSALVSATFLRRLLPGSLISNKKLTFKLPMLESPIVSDHFDILGAVIAVILGLWFRKSEHYFANDLSAMVLACCFMRLPLSFLGCGVTLPVGLIVYGILWMDIAAPAQIDLPFTLMWPYANPENRLCGRHFVELGLPDIVIPGIFISTTFGYDVTRARRDSSSTTLYSIYSFMGFIIGFIAASFNLAGFERAAALLYIIPPCVGVPLGVALLKGELRQLVLYPHGLKKGTKPPGVNIPLRDLAASP